MTSKIISNLSVNSVIFSLKEGKLLALFVRLNTSSLKGCWELPGGFVNESEELMIAPARTLKEIANMSVIYHRQIGAFSAVDRVPEKRVVTVGFFAFVRYSDHNPQAGPDAQEVKWIPVDEIPELAFEHREIFDAALENLKRLVRIEPIVFNLLPQKFSLTQIQLLYEVILNEKFDKRNFRKKLQKMNLLIDLGEKQTKVSHRAARLYSFDIKAYDRLTKKGFVFDL